MPDVEDMAVNIASERKRILEEYERRRQEISGDVYASWQPWLMLAHLERKRLLATMLQKEGIFPKPGDKCLEVGFGYMGLLGDLISWGVREKDLHGVELVPERVARAREIMPGADLRVGDGTKVPWDDDTFHLVIACGVFTSILNSDVRKVFADEITRVIAPGGALLWYDFTVNNPSNPNVRKVGRQELIDLFPKLRGKIRSASLAPPIARLIAPRSWTLATILQSIPFLHTHLIAVLVKRP